jgi:hypothetical protein
MEEGCVEWVYVFVVIGVWWVGVYFCFRPYTHLKYMSAERGDNKGMCNVLKQQRRRSFALGGQYCNSLMAYESFGE